MPLNYVTLTGKIPGGGGAVAWLALSGWTPAAADSLFFPPKHDPVTLAPDGSFTVPGLLANDSSDIAAGSYWTLTIRGIDGVPSSSWNFFLNYAQGAVQDVSGLAMVSSPPPAVPYMPVPAGEAEQGYVPVATGDGQASAWGPGGGGGSGTVTDVSGGTANGFTVGVASPATTPAVSVKLGFTSGLVKAGTGGAASAATAGTDYLAPNGSGAALTGITATQAGADASGAAAAAQAAAEAASDPSGSAAAVLASSLQKSSNLGDLANAGTARTNLALGSAATHASTDFDAAGAAATAQANAEAASLPVTDDLSAIATANATAGNVAMNSHKLTGLANGSASGDSAAFGQTPAGGSTATIGQGGTGQVTQQAALDAIAGAVTSGLVLRGNGSHVSLAAIQAGDVPTLNQNTSGTAANLSGTPAVPNGTTATTQAAADSSTKLATTAYADNSASTAAGSKLAKSANLSDIANAATALANLGLPTPTTQNQVPVSNSSDQWTLAAAGTVGGNTYNAGWTVGTSDLGGEALYSSASAGTATIPMGLTSVAGATLAFRQLGAGALTVAGASGVTVNGVSQGSAAAAGQYQALFARQVSTDVWAVTASYGSGSPLALPSVASLMPAWMPAAAISENFPRLLASGGDSNQATTFPFFFPGPTVPAGKSAGHLNLYVSSTAGSGQNHAWVALCDLNRKVLAVSADALTVLWSGGGTFLTASVAFTSAFVPAVDTPTIAVLCQTGSGMTSFRGYNGTSAIVGGIAGFLAGSSNGAQSAPPSVGATLTAITGGGSGQTPYCWLTA